MAPEFRQKTFSSTPVVGTDIFVTIKDIDAGKMFLFNLKEDIGETRNLMEKELELANKMYDEMTKYFKSCGWNESMISNAQNKTNEKDE